MTRALKRSLSILLLIMLALAGIAIGLRRWIDTADFRARVAREASAAASLTVELGGLSVDLWPLPADCR